MHDKTLTWQLRPEEAGTAGGGLLLLRLLMKRREIGGRQTGARAEERWRDGAEGDKRQFASRMSKYFLGVRMVKPVQVTVLGSCYFAWIFGAIFCSIPLECIAG